MNGQHRGHDNTDMLAGLDQLKKASLNLDMTSESYDIKDVPGRQDILDMDGFIFASVIDGMAKPCATTIRGIVCSTWTWMCGASVGRHIDTNGFANGPGFQGANRMASRSASTLLFLSALCVWAVCRTFHSCIYLVGGVRCPVTERIGFPREPSLGWRVAAPDT